MFDAPQHDVQLMMAYASGAELWYCPSCGKTFVTNWPAAEPELVLQPGDADALHQYAASGPNAGDDSDDLRLWQRWLQGIDFDGLGHGSDERAPI